MQCCHLLPNAAVSCARVCQECARVGFPRIPGHYPKHSLAFQTWFACSARSRTQLPSLSQSLALGRRFFGTLSSFLLPDPAYPVLAHPPAT